MALRTGSIARNGSPSRRASSVPLRSPPRCSVFSTSWVTRSNCQARFFQRPRRLGQRRGGDISAISIYGFLSVYASWRACAARRQASHNDGRVAAAVSNALAASSYVPATSAGSRRCTDPSAESGHRAVEPQLSAHRPASRRRAPGCSARQPFVDRVPARAGTRPAADRPSPS